MDERRIYQIVKEIVAGELKQRNLLNGNWHLGLVDSVVDSKRLKVFVDGGTQPQTIPCNPDVDFTAGDYVWVVYINGNARDKFVMSRRAI